MGLFSGGKSVNKPMGLIFGGAYLRKTPVCIVTFQTPCTILPQVILARVNFRPWILGVHQPNSNCS
jgi:hypothetical protein